MRKLKILALTAFAAFAISAVAAASALAEYHIASASGGTISASQQTSNEYGTTVGTVKCTTVIFTGSQATETASTLTLHPEYKTCTLSGQKVSISTTGCNLELLKPSTEPLSANLNIVCSGSNAITIKDTVGLGCEVKVGSQGPLSKVAFKNETSGKVLVTAEVKGITESWTAGCPNSGGAAGIGTDGTYLGSVLATGSSPISVT
jgi:hypothetical protein